MAVGFRDRLYPLNCAHCGAGFDARWGVYRHVKYDGTKPYCSDICKRACMPKPPLNGRPRKVFVGNCKHCGERFESKTNKMFCSLICYTKSDRFKQVQVIRTHAAAVVNSGNKARVGREYRCCMECGESFDTIVSKPKKFCTRLCMRKWLSARFDRWIASPKTLALPQNYDEFLSAEHLPCLVDGCSWVGEHLSGHMNIAHGIPAAEFKRAAGFNVGSGIIGADLQERLSARAKVGVAVTTVPGSPMPKRDNPRGYQSLEGREHSAKARALTLIVDGPTRTCAGCGVRFQQSTAFGRAKYCSIPCRTKHAPYAGGRKAAT